MNIFQNRYYLRICKILCHKYFRERLAKVKGKKRTRFDVPGSVLNLETVQIVLKLRDEIGQFLFNNQISKPKGEVVIQPSEEFDIGNLQ